MRSFNRRAAGIALLCALVVSAYLPALPGEFVWDDLEYVKENPQLRNAEGLRRIWTQPSASPQYYPMVFTSFWAEYRLWKLDSRGYHLVNVLLHTAGAVLLWYILAGLLVPGAWLAAALFALHPVNVESVAWITERKNTLSLVFFLGSIAAYARFSLPGGPDAGAGPLAPSRRPGRGLYFLALFLFVLALLSKTTTAVMPGVALILLWWKKERVTARDFARLLPFLALGAALGLFTAWLEMRHVGAVGPDWDATLAEKTLNAGRIVCFYLSKLFWPADLTFVYFRWDIHAQPWWSPLCPAAVAAGAAALWFARRRIGKGHLAAAGYFILCLAPVLGFLKIYPMRFSFVADHFQYLASIGPLSWAAAMLARVGSAAPDGMWLGALVRGRSGTWVRRGAAAAILALLWALTWRQCHFYRTPEDLWRSSVQRNPLAWVARSNLAEALLNKGKMPEALEHARAAVALKPREHSVQIELGKALYLNGRPAEAIPPLQEALRLAPNHGRAKYWLALARMALGQAGAPPPGHGR